MSFSRLFACDQCETGEALLTFAEEWGADSPESAPLPYPGYGKVQGLFSRLWCRNCQTVQSHILLRLAPPCDHAVVAYAEAQRKRLTGYEAGPCPVCSRQLMVNVENEPCPNCVEGRLHLIGEWEDAV